MENIDNCLWIKNYLVQNQEWLTSQIEPQVKIKVEDYDSNLASPPDNHSIFGQDKYDVEQILVKDELEQESSARSDKIRSRSRRRTRISKERSRSHRKSKKLEEIARTKRNYDEKFVMIVFETLVT